MGVFNYDNPIMAVMIRIANLMLLSFYWAVCCIPVVTIIPASAALYHTIVTVVQGNGAGVTKDFFQVFIRELKNGILLSVVCLLCCGLLAYGWFLGSQLWEDSIFGVVHTAVGLLLAVILIPSILYLPPVLSRFTCSAMGVVRLSLYFSSQHILRDVYMLVLLVLVGVLIDFYPVLLLILPAVYMDLIATGMKKTMEAYITSAGLSEDDDEEEDAPQSAAEDMGSIALDRYLTESEKEAP